MEKLKNILKSDTPVDQPSPTRSTSFGKVSGQGSHFPSKEEESIPATTTGTTVTGTEPQSRGPPDVSAAPASSTAAAFTSGPEQTGGSHINTTSASSAVPQTSGGIQDYTVSSADFPRTQTSTEGSGTAAVGETTTYSSSHLTRGDPTSSVVDPESSDPLTYKKPEAGVGTGAAATAAGLAFAQGEERRKGDMAGHENPYLAQHLDPRVDGLSKASAETATANAPTSTSTAGATSGATTGTGAGIAGAGATSAYSESRATESAPAPSALTSTVDPADRSVEYGRSTELKGTEAAGTTTSSVPQTETDEGQQSMFGKVLGAVGLGSVAGALGAGAATSRDTSAVAETPEQPTTTTGISSYTAPTEQGAPTSHHRKESIPTTAYPSATFDSPRAVNQPIGGAGSPVVHVDQKEHTGRDVAAGTAAGGAAVGAAAVGAHEYGQSKSLREDIAGPPQGSAPVLREAGETGALTGVGSSRYNDSEQLRQNIQSPSTAVDSGIHQGTTFHDATTLGSGATTGGTSAGVYTISHPESGVSRSTEPVTASTTTGATTGTGVSSSQRGIEQTPTTTATERDHTTRDTALGAGAGAAAVGAGAYGAHEYSKREAEKAELEAAKEQAAHEKELARQKAAQEKELEKEHRAQEKAHEKEEKKHQKELEKEEKHHQKQLEKEEKHREKEAEAAALKERRQHEKEEARLEKQREEEEEERRNREERERLAAAAGVGGTGVAAEEHEKEKEKEKKPSIFKRIFKRRKNKDTGEDEEYSSDEEHPHHNQGARAAYGAAIAGGAGTAGYAAHEHDKTTDPIAGTTAGDSTYEQTSGGAQKPSYNPFHKDETPVVTSAPGEVGPTTATATGTTGSQTAEAITGLPFDASKDPEAARRISAHTHGAGIGTFDKQDASAARAEEPTRDIAATGAATTATEKAGTYGEPTPAPAALPSTGTHSMQPTEAVTGTTAPVDTSGHSTAAATTGSTGKYTQQPAGAVTGLPHETTETGSTTTSTANTSGFNPNTDFKLGEIEENHGGLGEKIKDSFTMGGL